MREKSMIFNEERRVSSNETRQMESYRFGRYGYCIDW